MKEKRQDKQWLQALKVKEHKLTCVNLHKLHKVFFYKICNAYDVFSEVSAFILQWFPLICGQIPAVFYWFGYNFHNKPSKLIQISDLVHSGEIDHIYRKQAKNSHVANPAFPVSLRL